MRGVILMESIGPGPVVATRQITYTDAGTELSGILHWRDDAGPAAPILLFHGGAGLDEHARDQADRFARLGHPVFACDMYGKDVTGDKAKTMTLLGRFRVDREALAQRAGVALDVLIESTAANRSVVAIGYCFGGMAALALARCGAGVAGVVSIHGSLSTPTPARAGAIRARLLVCHGSGDPHVPMADVAAFADEMDNAKADWQLNLYGGAQHGFTHAHAVPGATPGVKYDAKADRRAFEDTRLFVNSFEDG